MIQVAELSLCASWIRDLGEQRNGIDDNVYAASCSAIGVEPASR